MSELPILSTLPDLADTLGTPERTVQALNLQPVGRYLPPGSRTTVDLYSVQTARQALSGA